MSATDYLAVLAARSALARVSAILERACQARSLDRCVDLVFEARNALADLPPAIARIGVEPEPFLCPDPVAAAAFDRRSAAGLRSDSA